MSDPTPDNTNEADQSAKYKYWRASIALSPKYRETFEARSEALGIKTLGDLVILLSTSDESIVEALKPHAERYVQANGVKPKLSKKEQKLVEAARGMEPAKLAELLKMAGAA